MAKNQKTQKLRAFRIENNEINKSHSGLFENLSTKLRGSKAEDRRMLLNEEDVKCEEDLISDFSLGGDFIKGVVLRVTHSEGVPNIPDDFLQHEKISINELDNISVDSSIIYKGHYYFLVSSEYVITNLQANLPIKRLQVYLNWLLEKDRGNQLYEITPLVIPNKETKLSDINKIIIQDKTVNFTENKKNDNEHKKFALPLELLSGLINDVTSLKSIIDNNIVSAELSIKFTKPRKMSNEDYQKVMGAYMKPISETDDVSFATKKNGRIKGSDILKTKIVEIELTETNKISEQQLYQEMEKFLIELSGENNN